MKWHVRKKGKKWGVFLVQEYCKTDEPVCYGTAFTKETAKRMEYGRESHRQTSESRGNL